jgi:hypothetical protein
MIRRAEIDLIRHGFAVQRQGRILRSGRRRNLHPMVGLWDDRLRVLEQVI